MLTSSSAPMLAAVSTGSIASSCAWVRGERAADRGYKHGYTPQSRGLAAERRAIKRSERHLLLLDVRAQLAQMAVESISEADEDAADAQFAAWLDRQSIAAGFTPIVSAPLPLTGTYHAHDDGGYWA